MHFYTYVKIQQIGLRRRPHKRHHGVYVEDRGYICEGMLDIHNGSWISAVYVSSYTLFVFDGGFSLYVHS